ncbi:MAG: tetratricopeptide repeat protein, partial [Nannocystaceae bacterium]|nr:tetratricopeptide repeat protein [Nannocystaceae bacterium]
QANRPERRRWILGFGLTGASLLVGGLALRADPEPCVGAQASLAATWNDGRRVAVAAAFKATELGYADTAWRHTESSLDAAAAVYIVEHREACLATRNKADEKAQRRLDQRLGCLADWRARVDATLSAWERADSVAVEHAVAGAANLPDAARCSDRRYLEAAQLPPGDAALAQRVAAVREKIRLAEAEFWAGHPKAAQQYAEPALADAEASGYPPVIAEALYAVGHALDLGGDYDGAFITFERAYLAANAIGYDKISATAAIEAAYLAGFRRAEYEVSDSWLAHARAAVARYGGDPRLQLQVLECEGSLAVRRGEYQEAIAILRRAVEDRASYPGVSELARAEVLGTLGNAYRHAGRHPEALAALEEVARIRRAATPGHPQTATAMNNVANVLTKLGRYDEAFEMFAGVLTVFRRAYGEEHADVSMALSNIGAVQLKRGNIQAAIDALTRAIEIRKLTLGPRHPEVGVSLLNLGTAYGQLLQTEKSERMSQEALEIFREAYGPDHPYVVAALTNIAALQQSMGKLDDALATFDDVERRLTAKGGAMHEDVAKIVTLRGELLMEKEDLAAARLLFVRALQIYEAALGAGHPDLAYPVAKLGDCARQEEDLGLAELHYRRAIQLMREANVRSPLLAEVRFNLARVLGHDSPEAIEIANLARDYLVSQSAEQLEEIDAWLEASPL